MRKKIEMMTIVIVKAVAVVVPAPVDQVVQTLENIKTIKIINTRKRRINPANKVVNCEHQLIRLDIFILIYLILCMYDHITSPPHFNFITFFFTFCVSSSKSILPFSL